MWRFVEMFGHMHFSDLVVDYALRVNTQSLHALTGAGTLSPEEVHGLRVNIKRLRAAWRLLSCIAGADVVDESKRRLKDVHGKLAASRDSAVMLAMVDKMRTKATKPKLRRALENFRAVIAGTRRAQVIDLSGVALGFQEESRAWRELASSVIEDGDLVANGYGRSWKKVKRLGGKCCHGGGVEVMHRWRREVKHCLYQLELIEPALSEANRSRRAMLARLGSSLGKHRDFYMLQRCVEQANLSVGQESRLVEYLEGRKRTQAVRAAQVYDLLERHKVRDFVRDVQRDVAGMALDNIAMAPRKISG